MNSIENDIDVVESGYEFLLAYAAQGRPPHVEEEGPKPHARPTITDMLAALERINGQLAGSKNEFDQLLSSDIQKAATALRFVLAQARMSSELVDNLNASIHLRTVLTDFFLYSEQFEVESTS
ncbi:MAG: hypothetical protein RQ757_08100 [Pseudomonadales bacterium]|nr:hypothetical protein [Pseudomonadales bacterium]